MPSAIRSAFSASVALAAAGVLAVSPVAPTPEVHVPTVQIPGIELAADAVPALGAIPYQILVNLLGDGLALAPIVIGGIEQCTVCIGPVSPPSPAASPFTGWGALGFGVGLLTSPFAIVGALQAGQSFSQSLGVALLAIQIPLDNTFALLGAPRVPYGGYDFAATRARAAGAVTDAVIGTLGVVGEVLTGVRTIIGGTLAGVTVFAQTLAATGDVVTAFNAGLAPISASITTAVGSTVASIQTLRSGVYKDLTKGPGPSTKPIPTVAAAAVSAATVGAARTATKPRAAAVVAPNAAAVSGAGESAQAAKSPRATGSRQARANRARSAG
jgi:hypothetical protein